VLGYSFWTRRFGRDPEVLGKTVYLDGLPVTIVGVTPPEFFGLDVAAPPDITVPLGNPAHFEPWIWARLKPGVSMRQAQPELEAAFQRVLETLRPGSKDWSVPDRERRLSQRAQFLPADKGAPGFQVAYEQSLQVLLAFAGVVLLIACANIASLLLARSAARAGEIGLRLAIGAGRRRLVRQLLTESVLLSLVGGVLGVFFALWGYRVLLALLVGENVPETLGFRLDFRVLAFTAALSVLTGVLFGIAPALRATGGDVFSTLKRDPRLGGAPRQRLTKSLVVVQVAASIVLLAGAGLFARTLRNLRAIDPGFHPESVLTMRIDAAQHRVPGQRSAEFYRELIRQVQAIPGVKAASLAEIPLFGAGGYWTTVWADSFPDAPEDDHKTGFNNVGPDFFRSAGVPLLAGREIGERDDRSAPEVVIVNEALAHKYWPYGNPVGRRLGWPEARTKFEIVGVVRNTKYGNLRQPVPPMVYFSLLQQEKLGEVTLHVRTLGAPALLAARIRRQIQALDSGLPVYRIETLADGVDRTLRRERMFATLSGFFGLLALALTCVGLYGVIACAVARRTNEIGLRIALGATRTAVVWMVLRETLMLVAGGAIIGVPAALASTRLLRGLLFGLTPFSPATLAAATLLLAALGAFAGYLPARRAALLDPTSALRHE
jgi:predicted permease